MSASITRKTDDTAPIVFTLQSGGAAIDLTAATGVTLFMSDAHSGTLVVDDASLTIDADPTTGQVEWAPTAGDMDTPGLYDLEFKISWTDLTVNKLPSDSFVTLRLVQDLETAP